MPLPNGNLYDNFLIHGCYYRHIDDLSAPWVPSPVVLPRELDDEDEAAMAVKIPSQCYSLDTSTSTSGSSSLGGIASPGLLQTNSSMGSTTSRQVKKNRKRSWISRALRRTFRMNSPRTSDATAQHFQPPPAPKMFTGWRGPFPATDPVDIVPLSDWKAWGYYACPFVNKVFVKNHSIEPRKFPMLDAQAMFESLRRPDQPNDDPFECEHPERWRRGQKLLSLPPRPTRWKPLDPLSQGKFPWECQLNPILTLLDPLTHTPTIEWSVNHPPDTVFFYTGPNGRTSPLRQPDFLQPATFPFVSHMYFNGLAFANDPYGWWARDLPLPWPVIVKNRPGQEGVIVDDIFQCIQQNFEAIISRSEFRAWSEELRAQIQRAYRRRRQQDALLFQKEPSSLQWCRRSDYLGRNVYLYGLRLSFRLFSQEVSAY
ncbi:hypothetical protein PM082_003143 [Marasmius tenuissimus]|nr:hypothetical protein PM082_003143 [Marasmius tenuissimus]